MVDSEVKLLQFIDAQIAEIEEFRSSWKTEKNVYYQGAIKAFECIKNYILEKKHLGNIKIESVLPAYDSGDIEKNNE